MDPATQAISALLATIGIAGIIGYAIGYAFKKVLKLMLILIGIFLGGMFFMEYIGVIEIHYDKLLEYADVIVNQTLGYTSSVYNHVVASIPTVGGFIAGFTLGFKKG